MFCLYICGGAPRATHHSDFSFEATHMSGKQSLNPPMQKDGLSDAPWSELSTASMPWYISPSTSPIRAAYVISSSPLRSVTNPLWT
jgi:hypothetical protein